MATIYEHVRNYQKTPKGKYAAQKGSAKRRGISWELTFDAWWKIWQESGKWDERGKAAEQYVMARKNDIGPYSMENVMIITNAQNSLDSQKRNLVFYTKKRQAEKAVDNPTDIWKDLNWIPKTPIEAYSIVTD